MSISKKILEDKEIKRSLTQACKWLNEATLAYHVSVNSGRTLESFFIAFQREKNLQKTGGER